MDAISLDFHREDFRAIQGFFYGAVFLVIATIFTSLAKYHNIDPFNLIDVQLHTPLLWFIDTMPCFIGLFASAISSNAHALEAQDLDVQILAQQLDSSKCEQQKIEQITRAATWTWEPETGKTTWSKEASVLLQTKNEQVGISFEQFINSIPEEGREKIKTSLNNAVSNKETWVEEHEYILKNGLIISLYQQAEVVYDKEEQKTIVNGIMLDITKMKQIESRIKHLETHDSITNLPRWRLFFENINSILEEEPDLRFSILAIDIDNFKLINDNYGHYIGENVLKEIGTRLLKYARENSIIGEDNYCLCEQPITRLAADEFIMLVAENKGKILDDHLKEIQYLIAKSIKTGKLDISVNAKIGVASYPIHGTKFEDVVVNADISLGVAKRKNIKNYLIYDPKYREQVRDRLFVESELDSAFDNNELRLYCQPIVSPSTQEIKACEALVRWNHPQNGLLVPNRFIPLAEESDLINRVFEWVLEQVCIKIAHWERKKYPPIRVSVNVSPRQVHQEGRLLSYVKELIEKYKIDPTRLVFEFTESVFMNSADNATLDVFHKLKDLGVGIYIDDYGVGYSSLHYLSEFPIDGVKIDRLFISDIPSNPKHRRVVESIFDLANKLKLDVIAEGVETHEQLSILRDNYGCDLIQGYYYSKPLPIKDFKAGRGVRA